MPFFDRARSCNADLVVYNANIITQNAQQPRAEAMAVVGDRIHLVGSNAEVRAFEGSHTKSLDAGGCTLIPGFNDAHNHMLKFGLALKYADLRGTRAVSDLAERIISSARRASESSDEPIVGHGYDQTQFAGGRHPLAADLSRAAPLRPVVVIHRTGHFAVANEPALALCSITASTPEPIGGRIHRDPETGCLTGLLEETAVRLLDPILRPRTVEDVEAAIKRAARVYSSEGITSSQEAGVGLQHPHEIQAYQNLLDKGELLVRVHLMIRLECLTKSNEGLRLPLGLRTGFGDHRLSIGPVKFLVDGSLVGRTAAIAEPYVDDGSSALGYLTMEREEITETIRLAHRSGWRVAVHALGERAIDTVLTGLELAQEKHPLNDPRHRIEHCAMITPGLLQRIRRLGVIPVPQQRFINELGDSLYRTLGPDRIRRCYCMKSFLDAGITIPGSSDRPVVNGAPLLGIHDAVNQRTATGRPYAPLEAVTAKDALFMYTVGSAVASREEHLKGRIMEGSLADFVILSDDLTTIEQEGIREIQVLATYLGGKPIYEQ